MKLEQQVVSLELAKKMKELGFEQESLFYWHKSWNPTKKCENEPCIIFSPGVKSDELNIPAYTVAELGEMLPLLCKSYLTEMTGQRWEVNIDIRRVKKSTYFDDPIIFYGKYEIDARAKMLIYLKENKLI